MGSTVTWIFEDLNLTTWIFELPTSLPNEAEISGEGAPETRYVYKASLIGSAHEVKLTNAGLSWRISGRSGVWGYADIAAIRLSYKPSSMQSRRFRADLEGKDGGRIAILSTTWQTATLMAPQDGDYRAFITQLHRRMEQGGSKAVLTGGLGPRIYAVAVVLLTLVGIAVAGLFIRAMATGEFAGALFLVGFAALFGWQIGGFMTRNRPRAYTFDHLPQALLPFAQLLSPFLVFESNKPLARAEFSEEIDGKEPRE